MKISELCTALQKELAHSGDIEVMIETQSEVCDILKVDTDLFDENEPRVVVLEIG